MSIDSEIAYATRVLKLPVTQATYTGLADQGRHDGWSFEEYLAAVLSRQVSAREANGNQLRIRQAKFPHIHTLEDFNFTYQASAPRELIAHLGTATFIANASNVVLLGPPGTGKTVLLYLFVDVFGGENSSVSAMPFLRGCGWWWGVRSVDGWDIPWVLSIRVLH